MPYGGLSGKILRRERPGCLQPLLHLTEKLQCLDSIALVPRCERVLRHGDDAKGLGEDVATLTERESLPSHLEVPTTILRINAVLLCEVKDALCCRKVLRAWVDVIVDVGEDVGCTALKPDRLGPVHQRAVTIDTSEHTAILPVETMLEPEGEDTLQQLLPALSD